MLPKEVVAIAILVLWASAILMWTVVLPYWVRKFSTPARRLEVEREKAEKRPDSVGGRVWLYLTATVSLVLPAVFIVDGLITPLGILYAPRFTFLGRVGLPLQLAGLATGALGLTVMIGVGHIIAEHIYARSNEERRLLTIGPYAYVRHPFYLHFVLLPLADVLLTMNYLALVVILAYNAFDRHPSFVTTWMKREERDMLERYGEEYEAYFKKTGRLIPRLLRTR